MGDAGLVFALTSAGWLVVIVAYLIAERLRRRRRQREARREFIDLLRRSADYRTSPRLKLERDQ